MPSSLAPILRHHCLTFLLLGIMAATAIAQEEAGPDPVEPAAPAPAPAMKPGDPFGDPLPPGAVRRIGSDRLRHASDAYSIDFLPDGKTMVSAGYDATVRFWNLEDGKLAHRVAIQKERPAGSKPGQADVEIFETALTRAIAAASERRYATFSQPLMCAELSPDGKVLACGGANGIIVLVDCEKAAEVRRFVPCDAAEIRCLAFSPDGKQLAYSAEYGTFQMQDLSFEKGPRTIEERDSAHHALAFLDGGRLAAAGKGIDIWDLEKGEIVRHLGGDAETYALAVSPDRKLLASGDESGLVLLWDPEKAEPLHRLEAHEATVRTIVFSPDGEELVSGCNDGNLVFWDVDSGTYSASVQSQGTFNDLSFSADGKRLAAAHAQIIRLWNNESGEELLSVARHRSEVTDLTFSPDDTRLCTVSGDTLLRVWDVETGTVPNYWSGFPARINGLDLDAAGKRLIAGCWHLSLFDLGTMEFEKTIEVEGDEVDGVAISPDGKRAVTSQVDLLRLWDLDAGEMTSELRLHKAGIRQVDWSPDGTLIAAGSHDKKISLISAADGKLVHMLTGLDDPVLAVAFSPDSSRLAAVGSLEHIVVFDCESGEVQVELPYKGSNLYDVAFSPDGRLLLTGNAAGQAFLYDLEEKEQVASWRAHESDVQAVAFSHDGKLLATGGLDGNVLIWETAKLLRE